MGYLPKRDLPKAKERHKRGREFIDRCKNVPCLDCKGTFPPECMDFDHRDASSKKMHIGSSTNCSIEAIWKEIQKCDIVCANCHRIRTKARGEGGWRKRDVA